MGDFHDRLAADLVGGAQERFVAELTGRAARMLADAVANPDRFRLLDRLSPLGAMGLWAEWRDRVTDECREAWESAVSDEDELLVSSLTRYLGGRSYETSYAANVAAEAARGMAEIMCRENVALASSVEREWYSAVADAVSRVEAGESRRRVMEEAVAKLASEGITTIDYRNGTRMPVDAALRRHVVTQANQARNDLLWRRMDEWGADLVFTSAHYGARPSHAVWQGRVFSRSGTSEAYPSLVEATGYGTAGGLCGVNCRHTMTPYVEGLSKLPDTDYGTQEKLTGLSSDEYYAATQAQRRLEAKVRATKREIAIGEANGVDETPARVRLGELQGRLRDHCKANGLRRDYGRERAYAVPGTAQPRALRATASVKKVLGRGSGGVAPGEMRPCKGVFVDRHDKAKTEEFVTETLRSIVDRRVEHAIVVQGDGRVFHAVGSEDAVAIDGVNLDGAIVIHNHPTVFGEPYSFGKNDYEVLQQNPHITLMAVSSGGYRYEMRAGQRIAEVGYDDAMGRIPMSEVDRDDFQHLVMRSLNDLKAIRYRRKDL